MEDTSSARFTLRDLVLELAAVQDQLHAHDSDSPADASQHVELRHRADEILARLQALGPPAAAAPPMAPGAVVGQRWG